MSTGARKIRITEQHSHAKLQLTPPLLPCWARRCGREGEVNQLNGMYQTIIKKKQIKDFR
jgi:hypothetical protein